MPKIPAAKLTSLLKRHTFAELLRRKMLFNPKTAQARTGMSAQHLRILCRTGELEHVVRKVGDSVQYFFLPEQLDAVFLLVKKSA